MEDYKYLLTWKSNLKQLANVFVLSVVLSLISYLNGYSPTFVDYLITLYYTFFCWFGSTYISMFCMRVFNVLEQILWRVILDIGLVLIYIYAVVTVAHLLFADYEMNGFWNDYFTCAGITMFISAVFVAQDYFKLYKEKVKESEMLKRIQIESELKILSSQVNPHFLFNSLNTLMALIPEDAKKAVHFTESFSKVYRYALQNKDVETVTVHKEIELIRDYCFLLSIRFGENFKCTMDIPDSHTSAVIPPFVLQLLVENATKHNTISDSEPLEVRIFVEKDNLVIWNNINEKLTKSEGTNTGLTNIEKRVKYLTGRSIEIEKTETYYQVILPIIFIEDYASSNH